MFSFFHLFEKYTERHMVRFMLRNLKFPIVHLLNASKNTHQREHKYVVELWRIIKRKMYGHGQHGRNKECYFNMKIKPKIVIKLTFSITIK